MIEMLSTMFSYQFMVRALIVGLLVSLCAALLGVSLVLKRYSMIGDGLSHVGFGALAVATALGMAPMAVTIPVVVAAAFLLLRLSSTGRLKGDAAIAMISTGALAVGVIVLSLSTGMTSDVNNYLFGSMLAMRRRRCLCCLCCFTAASLPSPLTKPSPAPRVDRRRPATCSWPCSPP